MCFRDHFVHPSLCKTNYQQLDILFEFMIHLSLRVYTYTIISMVNIQCIKLLKLISYKTANIDKPNTDYVCVQLFFMKLDS